MARCSGTGRAALRFSREGGISGDQFRADVLASSRLKPVPQGDAISVGTCGRHPDLPANQATRCAYRLYVLAGIPRFGRSELVREEAMTSGEFSSSGKQLSRTSSLLQWIADRPLNRVIVRMRPRPSALQGSPNLWEQVCLRRQWCRLPDMCWVHWPLREQARLPQWIAVYQANHRSHFIFCTLHTQCRQACEGTLY